MTSFRLLRFINLFTYLLTYLLSLCQIHWENQSFTISLVGYWLSLLQSIFTTHQWNIGFRSSYQLPPFTLSVACQKTILKCHLFLYFIWLGLLYMYITYLLTIHITNDLHWPLSPCFWLCFQASHATRETRVLRISSSAAAQLETFPLPSQRTYVCWLAVRNAPVQTESPPANDCC